MILATRILVVHWEHAVMAFAPIMNVLLTTTAQVIVHVSTENAQTHA